MKRSGMALPSRSRLWQVVPCKANPFDLALAAWELLSGAVQGQHRTLRVAGEHFERVSSGEGLGLVRIQGTLKDGLTVGVDGYPGTLSGCHFQDQVTVRSLG